MYLIVITTDFITRLIRSINTTTRCNRSLGGGVNKTIKKTQTVSEGAETASISDLSSVGHIELAVFTGQFTRDDIAGVDLLVVGDINPNALSKYVTDLEKKENKSIRYAVMNLGEFQYRQEIRDRFADSIHRAKKTSVNRHSGSIIYR
ncbi:MAG: hypothetical protein WDN66_01265 [Candidatus Saccharibacteria bacterium]